MQVKCVIAQRRNNKSEKRESVPCLLAPSLEMPKFSNLDNKAANHKNKQELR